MRDDIIANITGLALHESELTIVIRGLLLNNDSILKIEPDTKSQLELLEAFMSNSGTIDLLAQGL